MNSPMISVIMSVFNGDKFLKQAIESILNQTFTDFEFIIINDGSTDNTENIINNFNDDRIVKINNEKNIGLVKSLNIGLEIAKGDLLARMDADDVSYNNRFKEQVEFMDKHEEVGVLGTQVNHVDVLGNLIAVTNLPITHPDIVWRMLFNCPIIHPTVLMRADLIRKIGGYDINYKHIEDTELWSRLIDKTKMNNLKEVLYDRRLHGKSIISTQSEIQYKLGLKIKSYLVNEITGQKIAEKELSWLAKPEKILSIKEKENLEMILKDFFNKIIYKYRPSEETKKSMEIDLNKKLSQIDEADKEWFRKIIISIFKKIIPSPTRYYIKEKILKKIRYNR